MVRKGGVEAKRTFERLKRYIMEQQKAHVSETFMFQATQQLNAEESKPRTEL